MVSTTSIARRLVLPAVLLIGFTGALRADPMKPEDVEANRQSCMMDCVQQSSNADRCKTGCDCTAKAMGEQVTQEEYNAGKVAIANNKQPPQVTIDKLNAIIKTCRAQLN